MNTKRNGFTMIELLIVLAIIVVLSAVMAFANMHSASNSQAHHIINNFRSLRNAALSWHQDNPKYSADDSREILSYLNNKTTIKLSDTSKDKGSYMFHVADDGRTLYVGCELSNDSRIRSRLSAKADHHKLLGSDKKSQYNNDSQVWVQLL